MGLADAVAAYVADALTKRLRTTGVVTGSSGTQVIVIVDGVSQTLPRLAGAYPTVTVGDVVHIDRSGPQALILGKSA